jgi:ABC-type sugar transport system ATPase subunit
MNEIIRTDNLKKHYWKVRALDGIDILVGKGERIHAGNIRLWNNVSYIAG